MGGAMLGYASPYDDPLIASLATQNKLFGWDVSKQDFVFGDDNPIKKFMRDLQTPLREAPPPDKVVSFKDGKMFIGGKQIKNLPDVQAFGRKAGGLAAVDLKGTILDPSVDDFFYLDLGSQRKLGLFGKDAEGKVLFEGAEYRYIPISKQMLRTEEFTTAAGRASLSGPRKLKTKDGRLVVGKNDPAYNFIRMMNELQSGSASERTISTAVIGMTRSLGGKKGILSKMGTMHVSAGYRARLVPQTTNLFTEASYGMVEDIFKGAVGRKQLIMAIESREAMFKKLGQHKVYEDLIKTARTGKTFYAGLLADPMQRAEHFSAFEFSILDQEILSASGKVKVGELALDVQMHPLAYKIFERDTDLDAISVHLLDNVNYKSAAIRDRITRQSQGMVPTLQYFRDLGQKAPKLAEDIAFSYFSRAEEAAVAREMASAFLGQKAFASLGYSGVRPTVERLIPALMNAPMNELVSKGIIGEGRLTAGQVSSIRKLVGVGDQAIKEFGGTAGLAQYIFQGGVQKGAGKSSLRELFAGLVSLGEETDTMGLDLDKSLVKAHEIFYRFLSGTAEEGKQRIFQAGDILQNLTSLPEVLKGLEAGAAQGSQDLLLRRASSLLARTMGLSYALGSKVPSAYTLASLVEDEIGEFSTERSVVKRLFGPITGLFRRVKAPTSPTGVLTGQPATAAVAEPTFAQRMSGIKTEVLQDLSNITKSKMFKPAIGLAALAAGIGVVNRITAPDLSSNPLPPPSDTGRPTDFGPQLPSTFRPVARINTSSYTPSASKYKTNRNFGGVNSNFFENRVNNRLIIDDNVSSKQNSWLIRRQMNKEMESDFAY
jgi:hypothetical protein